MDSRQLRQALAVLESGSLGKAAAKLHISQPSLTKGIRRLEDELGVELFDRSRSGMRPTAFGECLRAHAQSIGVGIEQALSEIAALKGGTEGWLSVAAPPILASTFLTNVVLKVIEEKPKLQIRLATQGIDFTSSLLSGEFDLVVNVLSEELGALDLQQKFLFDDHLVVVTNLKHPLASAKRISLRQLYPYSWILPERGNPHRIRIERLFEAEGLTPPTPSIECNLATFIKTIALQSDFIGIVAMSAFPREELRESKRLAIIEIASPLMVRSIGVIWRKNQVLSPPARLFIETLESVSQEFHRMGSSSKKIRKSPAKKRARA